jgi:hypothetical protein
VVVFCIGAGAKAAAEPARRAVRAKVVFILFYVVKYLCLKIVRGESASFMMEYCNNSHHEELSCRAWCCCHKQSLQNMVSVAMMASTK